MFIPMMPDLGIDADQIVLIETVEQVLTEARMKEQLAAFSKALLAGNKAWGKWVNDHPDDWPRYQVWYPKALHVQKFVIPSMAFDFAYMSLEQVRVRFLMIEDVYKRLMLAVPSEIKV